MKGLARKEDKFVFQSKKTNFIFTKQLFDIIIFTLFTNLKWNTEKSKKL